MISYREKEMMMVMKYLALHSNEFAIQIADSKNRMSINQEVSKLKNPLPEISDYSSLVEYVQNCGYSTTLRINDLLSQEELNQLEKEYDLIEQDFKEQTGLNKTDIAFIVVAVLLQMTRQYLQPSLDFDAFSNKDKKDDHNESAKKAKDSVDNQKVDEKKTKAEQDQTKGSRYYHASLDEIADINHVPYDTVIGTAKYNVNLSGTNHRVKTLGHDPWLGYLFGTCNILTNTMSLGKDNNFRTLHIGKDATGRPSAIAEANPAKMFEYSIKRFKESKSTVGLAVMKQAYHIKSDEYSKQGIGLPFLQVLCDSSTIQQLCESGIDYAKLDFLGDISKQTMFAEVVNYIISIAHRVTILLQENKTDEASFTLKQLLQKIKKSTPLYDVRTKKVIMISECIASSANALIVGGIEIAAAVTDNTELAKEALGKLDIGGYLSTIIHLFKDIRFISKIKKDFIAKSIEENYKEKLAQLQ